MKSLSVFLLTALVLILAAGYAISDDPIQEWVARYNGPGNGPDEAFSIALDGDGNVYVTGWSFGSGTNYDYATIKYNSVGVEQWVARYSGAGGYSGDYAVSIVLDGYGNVYVTGYSMSSGTSFDYATIKYNNNGEEQWVVRYDGPDNDNDYVRSIALDGFGNVYVTGISFGSITDYDYATIKYNNNGEEQWVARYNGPGNYFDGTNSIAVDGYGNVYVTGNCTNSGINDDYATIKYNDNGEEQWVAFYDGPDNDNDCAYSIALDGDGNVYVTGYSDGGIGTYYDYATIKYDNNGEEQWVARYNGPGNELDKAYSIALDGYGNVYVTGQSNNGIYFDYDYTTIKYDSYGEEQWVVRYDGPGTDYDNSRSIALDGDGNVYVTGTSRGIAYNDDYATIKYSQATGIEGAEGDPEFNIRVYPCPIHTTASVVLTLPEHSECSLRIYGLDGRLVETLHRGTLPEGEHSFVWQTSQIPVGIYLLRVQAGPLDGVSRVAVIR